MKTCTRCKQEKELTAFSTDQRRSDGRWSWCRECHSAYQREKREKFKAREIVQCSSDREFGLWEKRKRMTAGVSVRDLAKLTRLERERIVEIEQGAGKGITPRECALIANVLKIDASELVRQAAGCA